MSTKIASFMVRQINRMRRFRDGVYLDTNAWSILAKGEVSPEPLRRWVERTGHHIWLARFQIAELSRNLRVARQMPELLRELPAVMLDRGQNEFQGRPWYNVEVACEEYIHLTDRLYSMNSYRRLWKVPFVTPRLGLLRTERISILH